LLNTTKEKVNFVVGGNNTIKKKTKTKVIMDNITIRKRTKSRVITNNIMTRKKNKLVNNVPWKSLRSCHYLQYLESIWILCAWNTLNHCPMMVDHWILNHSTYKFYKFCELVSIKQASSQETPKKKSMRDSDNEQVNCKL
jgi:hypothetical protein